MATLRPSFVLRLEVSSFFGGVSERFLLFCYAATHLRRVECTVNKCYAYDSLAQSKRSTLELVGRVKKAVRGSVKEARERESGECVRERGVMEGERQVR